MCGERCNVGPGWECAGGGEECYVRVSDSDNIAPTQLQSLGVAVGDHVDLVFICREEK